MSKNPWFPLGALLLICGAFYALIMTLGWREIRAPIATIEAGENRPPSDISGPFGVIMSAEEWNPDDSFRFPDDRAGKILSQTLPPSEESPAAHDAPAPRHQPPPVHLDKPSLPLPPSQAEMPRLPAGKSPLLRPRSLPEELPLLGHKADPLAPEVQHLYAGKRIRVPSVDVNKPIPLPNLAQPVSTRAPLDEVTSDASLAAALAATPPARTTPAPFLKQNLPDPFENRLKSPVIPEVEVVPLHTGSRPLR
jgi:hypothetical protein